MKLRSILISLVVFLVLLAGVGGFLRFKKAPLDAPLTSSQPQGAEPASPTAAMFVPKQSPVMASLLVAPEQLESFSLGMVAPNDRKQVKAEFDQFKQNLLSGNGIDYERDIQPWLGKEITIALTTIDLDRDASNGQQPGYFIALSSQDPEQAQAFLQLFWKQQALAGENLLFEQYSGVKLIYGDRADRSSENGTRDVQANLATAAVGDRYILFANHPKVLREAINSVQNDSLNLTSTSAYQTALDNLSANQIGLAVVNLPQTTDWLSAKTKPLISVNFNANEPEPEMPFETLLVALNLAPQGLVADTTFLTQQGQTLPTATPLLTEPVAALKYLPAVSIIAATGTQLNQVWPALVAEFAGYQPLLKSLLQPFQTFQKAKTLELSQDLFPWVGGDYSLGLLPRPGRSDFDWVFVAQKTEDPAFENGVKNLETWAINQGLTLGSFEMEGQMVSVWARLTAESPFIGKPKTLKTKVEGVRVTMDDYDIFASSVEAMDQALRAPRNSLGDSREFQQAIAPLSAQNDGYVYLNWPAVKGLISPKLPSSLKTVGQPLLNRLKSITFSRYGSESSAQRNGIFLRLNDA